MIGCIIFYDFGKTDLKGWFEYTLNWMHEKRVEPNTVSLSSRDNYLTFKGGQKILEQENYQVDDIEIFAGGEAKTHAAWKLMTSFDIEGQTAVLGFYEDIQPFDETEILKLAHDLQSFCNSKYAFATLRNKKNEPQYYALGFGTGLKDWPPNIERDEYLRIQRWRQVYKPNRPGNIYKTGDLRDVYPYNFICQAHLDRTLHGISLKQFINQPGHGTLQPLTDTLWTWKLTPDEESNVREELRDTGILLCV